MRKFLMLVLLVVLGVMTWRLGTSLSSDALGMAVGVVFGVLAGIPAALLVLATNSRRRQYEEDDHYDRYDRYDRQERYGGRGDRQLPAYPYQPPVIVVAGSQGPQAAPPPLPQGHGPYFVPNQANSWEPPRTERRFRVVGERDEWIE
jgi:hypothetical protein